MTGQRISHYTILGPIGKGGMGVVYKAEDAKLGRTVALKFLPPDSQAALGEDQAGRERFLREARIAARLNHPHICPIYDVDEADGRVFFAMAYIEGRPLTALITEGMSNAQVLEIGIQVASGLEEARRQGVVHRDIKASNIVVNAQGQAYILDFGLALAADSSRLTVTGGVAGTPAYMSPEQAQGLPVDHRSDVWSLGVVLFEMLTGRRPFARDKDLQVLYGIVHNPPAPLLELRPDLPVDYQAVIERALAKKPEERFQTAGELEAELRRLREGRPSSAFSPTMTMGAVPAAAASPARRWLWPSSVGLALVLASAGGFAYWRSRPALPAEKHIAVLPFQVIGGDANLQAITDGLVETLTARLGDAEDLDSKVMVVPASEIRARKIASATEAKSVYGANLVVTGSAQRLGDTVQLLMNLVDAGTMRQAGSRTLSFAMVNPLAVRDTAVAGLVRLLQMQALKEKRESGDTANATAYAEYLKGRGYLARYDVAGNRDRAIETLTAAVNTDPSFAAAYAFLAEAYWRKQFGTGDKALADQAVAAGERAVLLNPNLAVAHAKLGEIYGQTGRRDEAVRELQSALRLDPGGADAQRALADLYARMGRVREAEEAYADVTARRPGDWFAHFSLGVFLQAQRRYEEAERVFRRAETLAPDNAIVHRNLAILFVRTGRYRDAQAEARRSVQLAPSARGHSVLGLACYFGGRFPEAAAALDLAVQLEPSYYVGWGNLGSAYRHIAGQRAKSEAALDRGIELAQRALTVTPDDAGIHANLAEYYAKRGDLTKALASIARIPTAQQRDYWAPIAIAYKLAGQRTLAVKALADARSGGASPYEAQDDPDLADLLSEPTLAGWKKAR